MICKHCGVDDSDVTVDDVQDAEHSNSCSNSSPCNLCMELADLENAIARLKMKRCELKRNVNRRHSPFIRIPPEIISTISGFANTEFTIIGKLPSPILLSSVCTDWRKAVIGTPELWSSIKINLPSISQFGNDMARNTFELPRLASFIDEWLARSGQLPLNISLCSDYEIPWDSSTRTLEEYLPIFQILNKYSSRWHSFDISIPGILHRFLKPECLPLLEQLYITCISYTHDITFPPTPCLNTVKIFPCTGMVSEFRISPDIKIQWNTVTHLSLGAISSRDCFALLRLNPQLVHCTFLKVFDWTGDSLDSPILSSLTYLSYHQRGDTVDISRFLDNIKLPCLETLVLYSVIVNPVIALIERSACSLRTLSLLDWQIRKTDKLIPLLQFLSPSLKRLAISRLPSPIRGTKNYLSLLTRIYTSQSEVDQVVGNGFLPYLEIFEYREEIGSTLESSMLSNLPPPSQNCPNPAAISKISLRSAYISTATIINKDVPHDISVILQQLEADGILTYT